MIKSMREKITDFRQRRKKSTGEKVIFFSKHKEFPRYSSKVIMWRTSKEKKEVWRKTKQKVKGVMLTKMEKQMLE